MCQESKKRQGNDKTNHQTLEVQKEKIKIRWKEMMILLTIRASKLCDGINKTFMEISSPSQPWFWIPCHHHRRPTIPISLIWITTSSHPTASSTKHTFHHHRFWSPPHHHHRHHKNPQISQCLLPIQVSPFI